MRSVSAGLVAAACLKLGGWGLLGCLLVPGLFSTAAAKAGVVKVAETRSLKSLKRRLTFETTRWAFPPQSSLNVQGNLDKARYLLALNASSS